MPAPAHHTLFERPRIGPDAQHLQVVVGFQHDAVAAAESFHHEVRNVSQVNHNPRLDTASFDREGNRIGSVVRDIKGREQNPLYVKRDTGLDSHNPPGLQ